MDLSVYNTRRGVNVEHRHGCIAKIGGTHDKQDRNRVLSTDSDEVWRVGVIAGTNDVNECAMVMSEVHQGASAVRPALLNASRLTSESKACTQSSPLPRSRSRFLCRILHSRTPSRSYCTRFLTPTLKRPPARLAHSLA